MRRSLSIVSRIVVAVALVATVAFGFASTAHADDWARDELAAEALASLDPAIRTAVAARQLDAAATAGVDVSTPVVDEGFAWGAAALGVGVGVAAMCALYGCVTLLRHDGRLRHA
jgi:hypothetical protein